jgi:hypothetical protein
VWDLAAKSGSLSLVAEEKFALLDPYGPGESPPATTQQLNHRSQQHHIKETLNISECLFNLV